MEKRYINREEVNKIREIKYDHLGRMKKLVSGEINPSSETERRFLSYVNDDNALPVSIYEKTWRHHMSTQDPSWRTSASLLLHVSSTICNRCHGDGGVNGGCLKCDGRGWITPK